jgi:hypothetical protein
VRADLRAPRYLGEVTVCPDSRGCGILLCEVTILPSLSNVVSSLLLALSRALSLTARLGEHALDSLADIRPTERSWN